MHDNFASVGASGGVTHIEFHLRNRRSSFCFARNHQSPERNLPLGEDINEPMIASWIPQQPPECQGSILAT